MNLKQFQIAGSFRDPSGYVLIKDKKVFRIVKKSFSENIKKARNASIYEKAVDSDFLIGTRIVENDILFVPKDDIECVLEHKRVPFISYPYEWTFHKLKRAALHHLEFHLFLLDNGFTLSDASAYNIQFIGEKPIFIDSLSIIPYQNGQHWNGYKQFLAEFLNPLLFTSKKRLPFNSWYRGSLSGISNQEIFNTLSITERLDWRVLTFLGLDVLAEKKIIHSRNAPPNSSKPTRKQIPENRLKALLIQLHRWTSSLNPPKSISIWKDYDTDNTYNSAERKRKKDIVQSFIRRHKLKTVYDIGCNSGEYSVAALEAGADYVVGFDFDHQALAKAETRISEKNTHFLSLWLDASNPSPAQGWLHTERDSFQTRCSADGILALAIIHHLVIAKNIPIDQAISWLINIAPKGIIEFIPKSDCTVSAMLASRDDIFPDYSEDEFTKQLAMHAKIISATKISDSGRTIYEYERHY